MVEIDESYQILPDKLRGRKPKFKLQKDNKQYIYKYGSVNDEIWAELIAEQLGLQAGITMAHYRLAKWKDTIGVITDYFVGKEELIISSDNLKKAVQAILNENNILAMLKNNSLENIMTAAYTYDNTIDTAKLTRELMKRWIFYGLIMESDKNSTNISFIKNPKTGLRLSPDYDNSSMALLNKNIRGFIDALRNGYSVYYFTDNVKIHLARSEKDTGNFLEDFAFYVQKYPLECREILNCLSLIEPSKAIEKVEEINDVTVPWPVNFWVCKTINSRKEDLLRIFNKNNKDKKVKKYEL